MVRRGQRSPHRPYEFSPHNKKATKSRPLSALY